MANFLTLSDCLINLDKVTYIWAEEFKKVKVAFGEDSITIIGDDAVLLWKELAGDRDWRDE